MGTLNDLILACSDTCCEGLKNPEEHVIMKLFPSLKKWPLADAFHKVQIGTDSMIAGHEYYADAARCVWRLHPSSQSKRSLVAHARVAAHCPTLASSPFLVSLRPHKLVVLNSTESTLSYLVLLAASPRLPPSVPFVLGSSAPSSLNLVKETNTGALVALWTPA